jgi:succinate dehydrogenase / fumarate reductase cytochrome b subunit
MRLFLNPLGRKIIMAFTGIILFLFLVAHLLGNTTVFGGQDWINAYAFHIHSTEFSPLLWLTRIILLVGFLTHVIVGTFLFFENTKAAPSKGTFVSYQESTFSSRTMFYTGLLILIYLVYHLLHFTFHWVHTPLTVANLPPDPQGRPDLLRSIVLSFQRPGITTAYVITMGVVFLHTFHGVFSSLQTFGIPGKGSLPKLKITGQVLAFLIAATFVLGPLSVFIGWIHL